MLYEFATQVGDDLTKYKSDGFIHFFINRCLALLDRRFRRTPPKMKFYSIYQIYLNL